MPLYEYKCQECAARFERIEKASSMKDGHCPECGGTAHRLIGAPALQFKGSGWYVNDYGKGNDSPPEDKPATATDSSATKSTEKKPEKKADTKTDTKPEKKTDAKVA